ncbi:MAG: DUF3667 domain-containing protein [Aureispira sp.]|nr:DUF3667 domain-containing protein [Aureispira sp.]
MEPPKHLCQSCHCLVNEDAKFCAICGQKKILKPLSFKELIGDFCSNLFSLDSKFFRTFGYLIFLPGKLTKEYVSGRRQLYYTPFRLFLFWLTIALVLLNFTLADIQTISNEMDTEIQIEIYKDSLRNQLNLVFTDTINQQKLETLLPQSNELETIKGSFFSIGQIDSFNLKDFHTLSPDEIIKKYKVQGFFKQQIIRQLTKATKTPGDFQMYLLSHLSWIILISIPLITFVLKLLYLRRKKLYIEHLIYMLHLHTFIFISCSILFIFLLMSPNLDHSGWPILYTLMAIGLYFILSIKNVYQQSLLKSSFKIILFLLVYFFIIVLTFSVFVLINFFAF